MNKYYYDNAIDALYMAEKFGVEFYREYKDESAAYYDKQDLIDEIGTIDIKLYVIPESMSIFEPKDGDEWRIGDWILLYCDGDNDCNYNPSTCINSTDFAASEKPKTLICRNNKPFIMPKEEKDNE